MDRRQAMSTMLAGLLLPTWARRTRLSAVAAIPLGEFCAADWDGVNLRWDFTRPVVQESERGLLYSFASDARVAVRVQATTHELGESLGTKPPFANLPWRHDDLAGWRPWPAERPLVSDVGECPHCDGHGTASGRPGVECGCGGFGCRRCEGTGFTDAACRACRGQGHGRFPAYQEVGSEIVAVKYDRLIRRRLRGVEYAVFDFPGRGKGWPSKCVALRFDGGVGLLSPVEPDMRRGIVSGGAA